MADITTEELEELENEVVSKDDNIKTMQEFVSPESLYQELIASVKKYHPSTDISLIEKAYKTADTAHKGQVRKSGEAYIIHPLCVAIILAELELDKETIVAGLLHDVVEDTVMTVEEIASEFSEEIALLVDGVTKLGQLSYDADKVEVQAENLRKMFLAMAKDIRVILIKLADRLHNMRTLKYMTPEKQKEKARETMDIYAPIAQRLGISKIKIELDDLSLKYLEPEAYYDLVEKVALRKSVRDDYVQSLVKEVSKHIENAGIKAQIDGRAKHFFSIYKKMVNQHKTLDQIYDLFAIRIIVDNVKDCYAALGVIHEMYKPIPGRFKDYIAMPKPNMYQSLHTTVIGKEGIPFEVQIRTWEMHQTAEYGIAAHWKYKLGGGTASGNFDKRLAWIRQMLESQSDSEDVEDIVRTIKSDLVPEEVFVFTPKGDVINLPVGATVIDFAYAIHSAIGNRMTGAKVDGRIVPIDYQVKTGEIVEVLTSSQPGKGPSRDWLKIVKTSEARSKIRNWFKKERREDNVAEGKIEVEREFRRSYIRLPDDEMKVFLQRIAERQHFDTVDDFYAAIGYGGVSLIRMMPHIKDEYNKIVKASAPPEIVLTQPKKRVKSSEGVIVEGIDNCLVKFSRCCTPVPGDDIIGYITRGQGVSIHRTDCENAKRRAERPEDEGRWINVSWADEIHESYTTTLTVVSRERGGLVMDIATVMNALNTKVRSINARDTGDKSIVVITLETKGLDELKSVINKIQGVSGVVEVNRNGGKR